ncbi:J domain-containing protein [Haloplanus sp. C73]|uniref:J domain-containing protein n=1 Tax=Haloplanus sp. C73 TaxID=3421641 RepID=UPI003EBFF0D7
MLPEWVGLLPSWLLTGVAGGAAITVVVAGIFVAGDRLFPSPPANRGPRVDGTDRRHAEIRTQLASLGERYVEDATVGDDTVAFYLPERDVAITFDPQVFFRIEGGDIDAILCEYEMPGAHLGRRLPFETPGDPVTATGRVERAFAHLDLPPTADADEVRAAYRNRVKDVHPDHGGDGDAFRQLQDAYATAKAHAE